jgi:hypothetical protein
MHRTHLGAHIRTNERLYSTLLLNDTGWMHTFVVHEPLTGCSPQETCGVIWRLAPNLAGAGSENELSQLAAAEVCHEITVTPHLGTYPARDLGLVFYWLLFLHSNLSGPPNGDFQRQVLRIYLHLDMCEPRSYILRSTDHLRRSLARILS